MKGTSRIRRLASETAVYGISSVFARLINFLLFPFYSHVFVPGEYGIVNTVFATFIFLNVLYQYGMESAYLKYASDSDHNGDGRARSDIFSTSVWSLVATSLLFSALLLVLRGPTSALIDLDVEWQHLLYYVAAILILDTAVVVPFAELRLTNRPVRFAVVKLINVGINVGLNLVLILGYGMGIEAVFIANLVASASSIVLMLPSYLKLLRPAFDRSLWREMLYFGLPFIPGGLGYAFSDRVNLFFLQHLDGEQVTRMLPAGVAPAAATSNYIVGLFSGATKIAVMMALVVQMFRYAWQPFFLQHSRDEDAAPLFGRVFGLFVGACILIALGVTFFAKELVALPLPGGRHLIAESYWPGLVVVPILLLGYVFQGMYYNFSAGAYITKNTKFFATCAMAGAVVAIVLNAFLVPRYGMYGAAWATAAAYFTMAISLHFFVQRVYPVPYPWLRTLALFAVGGGSYAAWIRYTFLQSWYAEAGLLVGVAIVAFLLMWRR
ncbi:MAG: polysaccharide biosynthesis C-terminal domain-containing protein [Bacteroidetes bacterium]|nr:polysaccharide biosynthesis C-terminal domain-containing protein [Bacteroidota bacterium]